MKFYFIKYDFYILHFIGHSIIIYVNFHINVFNNRLEQF